MKILHVSDLHGHLPWMLTVSNWARDYDCVSIAGDSLPMLEDPDAPGRLRDWLSSFRVPVFYSRGAYDPIDMRKWGLAHLHVDGTTELKGWAIHVVDTYSIELRLPKSGTLPGVIISHFPPALSMTSVPRGGGLDSDGRGDVGYWLTALGDVRLCLHGRIHDPELRADMSEGVFVVNPGISYFEHQAEPSFVSIDADRRTAAVSDGRKVVTHSFAR